MSSSGVSTTGTATATTSHQEAPPTFKRVAHKIQCAAMVANLARSWQGWATQHSQQQESLPSGWRPSSVQDLQQQQEEDGGARRHVAKLSIMPRVVATATSDDDEGRSGIRCTGGVSRSVRPTASERSSLELLNAIRHRMEAGPQEAMPFLGKESPTRRRQMRMLQSAAVDCRGGGMVQGRKQMLQEKKEESRSSSLETEDSGLGEDGSLSDGGEAKVKAKVKPRRHSSNRPKIKVTTMGDIKSRWLSWSEQHMEGQRVNPFSEDFDHEYAMAQRLRKGDSGYGRPKEGSKTAERGERAQHHIHQEMEEMVWIITEMGHRDKEGRTAVTFGRLFDRYVKISDKVVGILLRCRKHKMLDFEGEMLWKGQDDHVVITLRD